MCIIMCYFISRYNPSKGKAMQFIDGTKQCKAKHPRSIIFFCHIVFSTWIVGNCKANAFSKLLFILYKPFKLLWFLFTTMMGGERNHAKTISCDTIKIKNKVCELLEVGGVTPCMDMILIHLRLP
jgi:hypothetical protein